MWLVVVALIISSLVRLPFLAQFPRGFTPDEAAFGYNAYSLAQTGRDEWGTPFWQLPTQNLRSFGDYKLPLYAFITVPAVSVLGLNEYATRLPNAIIGSLGSLIIYIVARRLIPKSKPIATVAAFVFAISPWSIQMSRGAFEANLPTLLLPLAFAAAFSKRPIVTALVLGITFYSYHSGRILSLLVVPILMYFMANKTKKILLAVATVIFMLPGLFSLIGTGSSRVSDVSIFHPTDNWAAVSDRRFESVGLGEPDQLSRVFSNKLTFIAHQIFSNYLQYFSPEFLFINGPAESTYGMIKGRGVFFAIEIVGMVGFLIYAIKYKSTRALFILGILAISPLPAVLAKGPGYAANRAITMLPWFILMVSWGFVYIQNKINKTKLFVTLCVVGYLILFGFFAEDYVVHSPLQTARGMNYGWKEALDRSKPILSTVEVVQVDRGLSEPHIFVAFYLGIPPRKYQQSSQSWKNFNATGLKFLDQYDGYYLDNFRFGEIDFDQDKNRRTLYIARPEIFPVDSPEHFHINYPDGHMAIKVTQSL